LKLAYYITVHHKAYQFEWLFKALYTDTDLFIIHIDRKSPEEFRLAIENIVRAQQTSAQTNVFFLPRRSVHWGGWSQVSTELRAIRAAFECGREWQYFVNLSGQDYPIQSLPEIRRTLREAWPRNFIRVWSFDHVRSVEPEDPHLRKLISIELFGRVRQLPFRLPDLGLSVDYKGSQWHILTREYCQWILVAPIANRLASYLRFWRCPEEVFFQAAIMNSPFIDLRMEDAARLFVFPGHRPSTLETSDLGRIFASSDLFARKFDAAVDRSVLESIAERRGYSVVG
jgi:Core-2/I-Branching enzyme